MSVNSINTGKVAAVPLLSSYNGGGGNQQQGSFAKASAMFSTNVPQLSQSIKNAAQSTANKVEAKQDQGEREGNENKPQDADQQNTNNNSNKIAVKFTEYEPVKPFVVPQPPQLGGGGANGGTATQPNNPNNLSGFSYIEPPKFDNLASGNFYIKPPEFTINPIENAQAADTSQSYRYNGSNLVSLQSGHAALDRLFVLDQNAGFNDANATNQYRDTLSALYTESKTFQAAVDLGNQQGKQITLSRNQYDDSSSSLESYLMGTYRTNIAENNKDVMYVFKPDDQSVALEQGVMSLARSLTHELMNVLGFQNGQPLADYMEHYNSLDTGKAAGAEVGEAFATGPAVRLTNQVLNESNTHQEDPRALYKAADSFSQDDKNTLITFLNNLHNEDFAVNKKYELLYLSV